MLMLMLVWPGNADWLVQVLYVYIVHQCKNSVVIKLFTSSLGHFTYCVVVIYVAIQLARVTNY